MTTSTPARVLLVRHGRTALNAEGRLRGHADPELDEVGVAQVQAVAAALRVYPIVQVVTSPLQRAVATGAAIAEAAGVGLVTDESFTDRDYGPWTTHVKVDVIREWGRVDAAPGVEDAAAMLRRAMDGLARRARDQMTVVIVTHDALIRAILSSIKPRIDPIVETASWAVLNRDETGWHITSFDNTAPFDNTAGTLRHDANLASDAGGQPG